MRKNYIIALFFILSLGYASAWTIDEAKNQVEKAEASLLKLEDEGDFKDFIPYDIYNDSVINIMTARNLLEESGETDLDEKEKEKLINESYYYSSIAMIKLDTARYRAKSKQNRIDSILQAKARKDTAPETQSESDDGIQSSPTPPVSDGDNTVIAGGVGAIFEAGLTKKDHTFRVELFDRDILIPDGTDFNRKGLEKIQKITNVLKSYPSSQIQVVGHTSNPDARGYSLAKARLFSQVIEKNGINKKRITSAGLGNNVVMETPLGYKRIDRIEIIITGIH